jgi:hypothetical protein
MQNMKLPIMKQLGGKNNKDERNTITCHLIDRTIPPTVIVISSGGKQDENVHMEINSWSQ